MSVLVTEGCRRACLTLFGEQQDHQFSAVSCASTGRRLAPSVVLAGSSDVPAQHSGCRPRWHWQVSQARQPPSASNSITPLFVPLSRQSS